jgi:beta-N-acetylhexosaminidase
VGSLALLLTAAALAGGASDLTPQEKAALVVVSGQPAPPGVGGIFVRAGQPRPRGQLVFSDQEGGLVKDFPALPPWRAARDYATVAEARAAGRETGRALRRVGVDVDLAPVLDTAGGPLGSRHFRTPAIGVAFGRGLLEGGAAACAKHFPGLGTAAVSTDERPHVAARVTARELSAFRAAIRNGIPCVMVGHAFYRELGGGRFRASLEPAAYRRLRALGLRGVAITDSMNVVAEPPSYWPAKAMRAGADLLLYTNAAYARRAIEALVPLARRGELDAAVERVLAFRARYHVER